MLAQKQGLTSTSRLTYIVRISKDFRGGLLETKSLKNKGEVVAQKSGLFYVLYREHILGRAFFHAGQNKNAAVTPDARGGADSASRVAPISALLGLTLLWMLRTARRNCRRILSGNLLVDKL